MDLRSCVDTSAFKKVMLSKVMLGRNFSIDRALIEQSRIDIIEESVFHTIASIRTAITSHEKDEIVIDLKYPRDWKEAFKERWFPKWLLKKHPVQYKEHHYHYKILELYPTLVIPEHRGYIYVMDNSTQR